ncbi:hypothetical protein LCGC14_3036140, partial [marine sediment metagenome]
FCADIFSNDTDKILLLAQWFGYNLIPDMSMEKFMLFIGRPRSGKSTMLETMSYMLGQEQCCSTSFQSLCGPFGFQPLIGKLAALVGDAKVPHAREADSALEKILQITGGDPVTINRKRIKQLSLINLTCRFTIVTNDLPAFTDHARALEPRMNILDFENSYIGREDRHLKARLNKEAAAGRLINFALRGLKRLREKQNFTLPKSSYILQNQFRTISNPIHEFVAECCEFAATENKYNSETFWAVKNEVYETWRNWCKANGRSPGIKTLFFNRFFASYPDLVNTRRRIASVQRYIICGVCLTNDAKLTYLGD